MYCMNLAHSSFKFSLAVEVAGVLVYCLGAWREPSTVVTVVPEQIFDKLITILL